MLRGSESKRNRGRLATLYVVRVAFLAALLTVGKLALSFVPNVEVVTLFVIVYGSALGIAYVLPATLIFCAVEVALYGVGSWVLLYFVYWPLLGVVSALVLRGKNPVVAVIIGAVGSALFGLLSACCTTLFAVGNLAANRLGNYFMAYWLRGLYFDLIHVVSSAVTVGALYLPLVKVMNIAASDVCLSRRVRGGRAARIKDEYVRVPRRSAEADGAAVDVAVTEDVNNAEDSAEANALS